MSSNSLSAMYVLLAIINRGVLSQNAIMSWHIYSTKGSEILKFTQEAFEEFSVCLCTTTTKICTLFSNQITGFLSYVNSVSLKSDDGLSQLYPSTYLCERRIDASVIVVQCTRLELSSCSDATLCWTYDILFNDDPCELGPVKITWTSSQQFQKSFDNTKLTISSCSLTCPYIPASQGTTSLLPQSSGDTTKFSTSTATNLTVGGQDDNNNTGTTIGVVVAVVVCAGFVAMGVVFCWRRKKARKADKFEGDQSPTSEMANSGYTGPDNGHSGSHEDNKFYMNVPAGQRKQNSTNPSYYNLTNDKAHMSNISTSDTTDGVVSTAESREDYINVRSPDEGVDDYEEPVTASPSQGGMQAYYNVL